MPTQCTDSAALTTVLSHMTNRLQAPIRRSGRYEWQQEMLGVSLVVRHDAQTLGWALISPTWEATFRFVPLSETELAPLRTGDPSDDLGETEFQVVDPTHPLYDQPGLHVIGVPGHIRDATVQGDAEGFAANLAQLHLILPRHGVASRSKPMLFEIIP